MATFYIDMKTGNQLSASQLVPGQQYVTSGTGSIYTAPTTTQVSTRTPITLGNGQVVYYDKSGGAWDSLNGGKTISSETISNSKNPTITSPSPAPVVTSPTSASAATTPDLTAVNAMIDKTGLAPDQVDILKKYAEANFTKSPELANNIMSALTTATQFATPEFKQQAAMLQDALKLNFNSAEGDLAYKEKTLKESLAKTEADYAATSSYNTFEQNQKLKEYADSLKNDLLDTQDKMAASGFTSSSKRQRAEDILTAQNQGLVESTNKTYGYQADSAARALAANQTNVAEQIQNLKDTTGQNELSALRTAESKLGTSALSDYGSLPPLVAGESNLLGGQTGSQNYDLTSTITKAASNFVY